MAETSRILKVVAVRGLVMVLPPSKISRHRRKHKTVVIIDARNRGVQKCVWCEGASCLALGCVGCVADEVAVGRIHAQGRW